MFENCLKYLIFHAKIVEIAPQDSNIDFWRENSNLTSSARIVLK